MRWSNYSDWVEHTELLAQRAALRIYTSSLRANPDCRDPDHPGCPRCIEPEEGDELEEHDDL